MNVRTTIILFGVLVVGLGIFGAMQYFGVQTPEERLEAAKWLLPSLKDKFKPADPAKDFTRIVVERELKNAKKTERLEFVKDGDEWKMVSPRKARVDSSTITGFAGLVNQMMNAEVEKYANLSPNLAEHGLDEPSARITLYRGDKESTVTIGDLGPQKDPQVFVMTSERQEPLAVKKSSISKVFAPVEEFRSKDLFTSTLDVTGIKLVAPDRKLELERVDNKDWKFKEPALGDADNTALEDIVRNLATIRVEKNADFVADGPKLDLAKYGLSDDKARLTVTIARKGTEKKGPATESLVIGDRDPQGGSQAGADRAARVAARLLSPGLLPADATLLSALAVAKAKEQHDQDAAPYFARMKNEDPVAQSVVRIDGKHLKNLDKKADELRSRHVARIDVSKTDAINLAPQPPSPDRRGGQGGEVAGETLRLRRPDLKGPASWDLWTDKHGKVKTHLNVVPDLIDAINKVELKDAKAFLDNPAKEREWFGMDPIDLGLDKPQAEITIWLEGLQRNKEGKPEGDGEPKLKDAGKDKPNIRLLIGRKDDKHGVVYVKRKIGDGPEAVLAVPDPWQVEEDKPEPPSPFGPKPPPAPRPRVSLTKLATGGYFAYRDHVLPSFKIADASKVIYDRAGTQYVVEKEEEKKDDKGFAFPGWKLKQPVEGKAGFAVSSLLTLLTQISADNLVTDKATPEQLKEFGLSEKPLLRATVTAGEKDKKPSEYTYIIGANTDAKGPNPNRFYVRLEVKPGEGNPPDANQFVFLLPWNTVQGLDVELRDTTVFESERSAKPEEITLTWRKLDKDKKLQETQLVLASIPGKEGGDKTTWTVKTLTVNGKDAKAELAKLDTAKVDQLLGQGARFGPPQLNPLHCERFVVHNGSPEPKHRLDPASKDAPPALVVEIKFDNQSTRTLTLGDRWEPKDEEYPGLGNKAFFYATASTLPKAVFLLDEAGLKELVAGVDFFKVDEKISLR